MKLLIYVFLIFNSSFIISNAQGRDSVKVFQKDSLLRTVGPLAYLNFGLGQDRLGGAKMGYIDSLVLLRAVAQNKEQYKVRLTNTLSAWIPKSSIKRDSTTKIPAQYLTSNWRVWGDERQDYVAIGLPERLPYMSWQEINPSKIIIDIFGATSNTNWITQLESATDIQSVDYEQIADEHIRVIIQLKHQQHWGYAIYYQGRRLVIEVRHQPENLKLKHLTIAIDAGHGGTNLGACGLRTNLCEKELNLMIAQKLKAELEDRGATVIMTRTKDTLFNNSDRILWLRQQKPDILVSIHNNASADTVKIKGTSTYYKHLGFRPLSQKILKRLLELGLDEYGNIGRFNFALNSPTEYVNVLVEGAFLSQPQDEAKLIQPAFQQQMAEKITKGIEDWLKAIRKSE